MRTLVRWALRSQSAEEFGAKMKQRHDRQHRRSAEGPDPAIMAKIEQLLDE
jgi:hypothetical protein